MHTKLADSLNSPFKLTHRTSKDASWLFFFFVCVCVCVCVSVCVCVAGGGGGLRLQPFITVKAMCSKNEKGKGKEPAKRQ